MASFQEKSRAPVVQVEMRSPGYWRSVVQHTKIWRIVEFRVTGMTRTHVEIGEVEEDVLLFF